MTYKKPFILILVTTGAIVSIIYAIWVKDWFYLALAFVLGLWSAPYEIIIYKGKEEK